MKSFYLFVQEKTNRVVLDSVLPEKCVMLLRTIEAKDWLNARLSIPELEFRHEFGYGYFQ